MCGHVWGRTAKAVEPACQEEKVLLRDTAGHAVTCRGCHRKGPGVLFLCMGGGADAIWGAASAHSAVGLGGSRRAMRGACMPWGRRGSHCGRRRDRMDGVGFLVHVEACCKMHQRGYGSAHEGQHGAVQGPPRNHRTRRVWSRWRWGTSCGVAMPRHRLLSSCQDGAGSLRGL